MTSVVAESRGYARAASRLTDGNPKTDAYPGAFSLDYIVDLTAYTEGGGAAAEAGCFDVESIVIDWGKYGRHFPGEKRPDGSWAPAAYKGDYVNHYEIQYRVKGTETWQSLHACDTLPTNEQAENVRVARDPPQATFSEGEVITTLCGLEIRDVVAVRIRARGSHWIGVHELKVMGTSGGGTPEP